MLKYNFFWFYRSVVFGGNINKYAKKKGIASALGCANEAKLFYVSGMCKKLTHR